MDEIENLKRALATARLQVYYLEREIADLTAKASMTADGVLVGQGDKVFFRAFLKDYITEGHCQMVAVEYELADPETDSWREVCTHGMAVCYSTKEAAMKAYETSDAGDKVGKEQNA